ncbi:lipoprotein-releasing ABC transporter permease subunit [Futiania mangrovi]|uniref:Lipoprotein-releasing ABC transporter permease subunit n=1 Tax=Futiania mangrovi TaxID=2959716 RepID=A0A9J6PA10_9PROT|nr:lipoprotein-releasing ABC transporter permease subunit [Futiania mangrovii]MCP1335829.1 lipoprotein-releasing ABC transporter permease subunit [Futiania mangrovii]
MSASRPFGALEWQLALRYLRSRRRDGFISVIAGFSFLGIMLGVATLIIVMAVMNGFRIELVQRILGVNGHAMVSVYGGRIDDYETLAERLGSIDGIVSATPIVEGQVMASANGVNSGVLVRAMPQDSLARLDLVAGNVLAGSLEGLGEGGVAVGSRLAQRLGLRVGSTLTLISPQGRQTAFGTAPRVKGYPVAAIFEMGMSEYDGSLVFMGLGPAQVYFQAAGEVTGIELMVDNPDQVERYMPSVYDTIGGNAGVTTWKEANASFFAALAVERNVMFLILSLIILVAALNIIAGLIMLVKDKGHDIAILRTMGATRGAVMRVFFIAGAAIGVVGTLAGLVIGVLFCWNIEEIRQAISRLLGVTLFDPTIYFLARMPAELVAGDVLGVLVMALSLSFLATLYPSWRAARLDPVEALRYE